jgi:cystathionine gamma-synthase
MTTETARGREQPKPKLRRHTAFQANFEPSAHASAPGPTPPARRWGSATVAVRAAIESDRQHGAVVPPLHLSSTFAFRGFDDKGTYDYTRSGNPTRDALASAIADLEGGALAQVTSSGMSAIHLVVQLLEPGDLLLAPHDCYGGTYRLFQSLAKRGHFRVSFVDQNDGAALDEAFASSPKMLWIETPSNPLLRIVDIMALSARARSAGALCVVDNTFLSPALQQPLTLGADLVVHSTTKYLNGHSDVVGGAVIARDRDVGARLAFWANCLGLTGAPFDSYLTLRGLRTLHARLRVHEENALAIVDCLSRHPAVAEVFHPSLSSHPGHELACRQQSGFGAMVSFRLDCDRAGVARTLEALEHFSLAESLGGTESLVAHPATMTHASMDEAARLRAGIDDQLVRLSVGIEDANDLVADLEQALDRAIGRASVGSVKSSPADIQCSVQGVTASEPFPAI